MQHSFIWLQFWDNKTSICRRKWRHIIPIKSVKYTSKLLDIPKFFRQKCYCSTLSLRNSQLKTGIDMSSMHVMWAKDYKGDIFKLLRSPGINSASLCSPLRRYDNPIPTRFLAFIDSYKILAQRMRPKGAKSRWLCVRDRTNCLLTCYGHKIYK